MVLLFSKYKFTIKIKINLSKLNATFDLFIEADMINFPLIFLLGFLLIVLNGLRFDQLSFNLIINHILNVFVLHFLVLLILELLYIQFLQLQLSFLLLFFQIENLIFIYLDIGIIVPAFILVGFGNSSPRFGLRRSFCIPGLRFAFHVLEGCQIKAFWI